MPPPRYTRRAASVLSGSARNHRTSHRARAEFGDGETPASTPLLSLIDNVAGYESLSFDVISVPPPPDFSNVRCVRDVHDEGTLDSDDCEALLRQQATATNLSEDDVRSALQDLVKRRCCYGSRAADRMTITQLSHDTAFQYTVESFAERRETCWTTVPYGGEEVDDAAKGPAPSPWSVPVAPVAPFTAEVRAVPVPHTSSVKQCPKCRGSGTTQCGECRGKGWIHCVTCQGHGYEVDGGDKERCFACYSSVHGRGRQDCPRCAAKGRVSCIPCEGAGSLLCFIQLTVTWKVHVSEHVESRSALPEDLIREADGRLVIREEAPRLSPLVYFPNDGINKASAHLLIEHDRTLDGQRLLAQRHQVDVIPVTSVKYQWKSFEGEFFVYGEDRCVYAADYPQTCCWGCTIL